MIWIIGGTSETAQFISKIKDRHKYIITVATYAGKEVLGDENIIVSRLAKEEMVGFIKERDIKTLVDLSHPYAYEVSQNAREAAGECNIRYLRYKRETSKIKGALYLKTLEECMEYLSKIDGCVFFTTGIKYIEGFEKIKGNNRFIYRILPSIFSIEECVKNNVQMKDIVALLGPVSFELNKAMFKDFNPDYVVMKDSGNEGGTREKIDACLELGIVPMVIGRAHEDGIDSIDKLLEMI